MVMVGVLIKAYVIINFSIVLDEAWNVSNPRPYPSQEYYLIQWE